jgi:hypothetical protein
MPVKRRASKQRFTETALLEAWSATFEFGHDFFGDLQPLTLSNEESAQARAAFKAKAYEAWERLGAAFMAAWQSNDVREKPWAFEQFGEPSCQ